MPGAETVAMVPPRVPALMCALVHTDRGRHAAPAEV